MEEERQAFKAERRTGRTFGGAARAANMKAAPSEAAAWDFQHSHKSLSSRWSRTQKKEFYFSSKRQILSSSLLEVVEL